MKNIIIGFIDGLPVKDSINENLIDAVVSYFEKEAISKIKNNFRDKGRKEKVSLVFGRRREKHTVAIKAEYEGCVFYGVGISKNHRISIEEAKRMLFSKTKGSAPFVAVPLLVKELAH